MSDDRIKQIAGQLRTMSREELIEMARNMSSLEGKLKLNGPQNDDQLHAWIKNTVGIDIPRVSVCDGHDAPFKFFSDCYFNRCDSSILMANRGGAKTFLVALLHLVNSKFKPRCESATVGAIEAQARRAYAHLLKFMDMVPELKEDVASSIMSETKWKNGSKVEVLAGTISAVNGPHPQIVHFDEVELADEAAFDESRNMSLSGHGIPAQDIITSTRKRGAGLMQRLIDEITEAQAQGFEPPYRLFQWCVFETTQKQTNCQVAFPHIGPEHRCKCDRVVKGKWDNGEPRRFSDVCKGRLAKSEGWMTIDDVHKTFMADSRDIWEAQQECIKPSTEGTVLSRFSIDTHGVRGFHPDPENGPVYAGIDFGGCYDAQTEVLTKRGWVAWPEVTIEDEFASLDPKTEMVEFQRATEIVDKPYHGFMQSWRNQSVDLLVTADHNMLVAPLAPSAAESKWSLVPSFEVSNASRMLKTSKGREDSREVPFVLPGVVCGNGELLPDVEIPAEDWAAFLGLWMAEGHVEHRKRRDGTRHLHGRVGITHYDEENAAEISHAMSPFFNVRFQRIDLDKKRGQLTINDPRLYRHLSCLGKAPEKCLPDYVKQWSPRLLRIYLDWHMRGDGSRNRIYTSSKSLADDLQEIAMYAGLAADVVVRPAREGASIGGRALVSTRLQHVVEIKTSHIRPSVYTSPGQDHVRSTITPDEWGHKRVYCAVLPKHHTLYVRRNGKAVWCGNTNPHCVVWFQVLRYEIEVDSSQGMRKRLPEGSVVAFDEFYKAEIGNNKLAEYIVNREQFWRMKFPEFRVVRRFADPQGKAARLDLHHYSTPVRTSFYVTRDVKEHIKHLVSLIDDDLFYVDTIRCPMWLAEAAAWHYPKARSGMVDDPEIPVNDFDHAMAATRYGVSNLLYVEKRWGRHAGKTPGVRERDSSTGQFVRSASESAGRSGAAVSGVRRYHGSQGGLPFRQGIRP